MWDNRLWLRIGVDCRSRVRRGCCRVRLKMVAAGVGLIRMQEEFNDFWDQYASLRIGVDMDMNG
jgi:hypothetical protein